MVEQKTMGIIFANMHDAAVGSMTNHRSMAALPFGGRYRLIDFYLSSLVNGGVGEVGVVVKEHYHSLMSHLGAGREWDLARKIEGLSIYPPFVGSNSGEMYHGRVEAMFHFLPYLRASSARYSVLMDCDHVCTIDISAFVNDHIASGADVTMLVHCPTEGDPYKENISLRSDKKGRVTDIAFGAAGKKDGLVSMNVMVLARELLISLIEDAHSHRLEVFERDILRPQLESLFVRADVFSGYVRQICNIQSYFRATMSLLDADNRSRLFFPDRPVYTKVNDDAPVRYGITAEVKNSLIADGCVIEGSVENCVLFRGAAVEAGVKVKNSILMQNAILHRDANVSYVIADKYVEIGEGRSLMGHENYPLYIQKRSVI